MKTKYMTGNLQERKPRLRSLYPFAYWRFVFGTFSRKILLLITLENCFKAGKVD